VRFDGTTHELGAKRDEHAKRGACRGPATFVGANHGSNDHGAYKLDKELTWPTR
jgi:hypothetical protein